MHQTDIISGKMSSDIENMDWSTGTTTAQLPNVRFGSSSSQTSQNSGDICRICHCESDPQNPLLTPCYCSGSLKYVHQSCLQQWLTASETNACELCKFPFIMHTKIKPFNEWRSLDMSGVERRRLFCAVLFHFAAALCVIWSLCVLIERAAEEVKRGLIGWPFWTKLVVVTVGLTGGVVFMYIQCRQYLHLCNRWRARNRILLIQNAPEKNPIPPPSPVLVVRHHNLVRQYNSTSAHANNGSASNNNYGNRSAHGQIVANIENNPSNYERDWMLDDSSQSSFKPYHQGSGSLTPLPFHDSAHTMYEPYQMQSSEHLSGNGSGRDLNQTGNGMYTQNVVTGFNPNMQHNLYSTNLTAPTTTSNRIPDPNMFKINAQYTQNFPNTSIFLENRDILDDKEYPKLYHRHSTIIDDHSDNGDHGQDINRRYSDTKLLQTHNSDEDSLNSNGNENEHVIQPIFNVANVLGTAIPSTYTAHQNIVPQITDIIFENTSPGGTFDPLNINEQNPGHDRQYNIYPRHSMHNVALRETRHVAADNRNVFKSMPNLSGSSENLLQMQ